MHSTLVAIHLPSFIPKVHHTQGSPLRFFERVKIVTLGQRANEPLIYENNKLKFDRGAKTQIENPINRVSFTTKGNFIYGKRDCIIPFRVLGCSKGSNTREKEDRLCTIERTIKRQGVFYLTLRAKRK